MSDRFNGGKEFMPKEGDPPGEPNRSHPEPDTTSVEQFFAKLRFEQRNRLAELPTDLV